jgi:hypothetical protein
MEALKVNQNDWTQTSTQVFWGEIAPCEHVVQIYEDDDQFIELLNGYTGSGITAGDCVIVIATANHLASLRDRLTSSGFDVDEIMASDRYVPLDAEAVLSRFMVNDWPDETLFNDVIRNLIGRAKNRRRKVRAFGEMVALLWAKGQVGATVRLEQLWNKFCENEAFALFCAYPQSGFTQDAAESVTHICGAHSKMIAGTSKGKTELFYRNMDKKAG